MKNKRILLISANRHKTPYPVYPIGLSYLKSHMGKALPDWEVEIADCNLLDDIDLVHKISTFSPHYIGISFRNVDGANSLDRRGFFSDYKHLAQLVKSCSQVPVIIGGAGFSIFSSEFMRELPVDYGIHGEGEEPLVQLILRLEKGELPHDIPAVLTSHISNVTVGRTYLKNIEADFDTDLTRFYWQQSGMLNIQTKRGCPYHCIYCSYPHIDGRCVRTMDVDVIVDNIARLHRDSGVNYLFFTDSVFNICNEYNVKLAQRLVDSKLKIQWGAYFSPSNITNDQMELFRASGLTHIEFGTESFCDETLEGYGKNFTFDDVLQSSQLALKHNVYYSHFLILGGYGETKSQLAQTIENSKAIQHSVIFPYVGMRIYPHTALHRIAIDQGVIDSNDTLVNPRYYLVPDFDLDETRRMALATNKAWVFPDDEPSDLIEILRIKKNKKGPLWEYLRKP